MTTAPFRYDERDHAYFLGDAQLPSVTQLLKLAGLVDDTWFTPESRDRGTLVHDLTRDHDLGALVAVDVPEHVRGYVKAYQAAALALKPTYYAIEEPDYHPQYLFAGRPDRIGKVFGLQSVMELKSGGKAAHHAVQTALQAILVGWRYGLPAERWQRLCVYLTREGRYRVETHADLRDFDTAKRILQECL